MRLAFARNFMVFTYTIKTDPSQRLPVVIPMMCLLTGLSNNPLPNGLPDDMIYGKIKPQIEIGAKLGKTEA